MTPQSALTLHDPARPDKVIGTVEIDADTKAIVGVVRNSRLTHPSERFEIHFGPEHEARTYVLLEVASDAVRWEDR